MWLNTYVKVIMKLQNWTVFNLSYLDEYPFLMTRVATQDSVELAPESGGVGSACSHPFSPWLHPTPQGAWGHIFPFASAWS